MDTFKLDMAHVALFLSVTVALVGLTYLQGFIKALKRRNKQLEGDYVLLREQATNLEHEIVELRDQLSGKSVLAEERERQLQEERTASQSMSDRCGELQAKITELSNQYTESQVSLREREANIKALSEQYEQQKDSLKEQFQLLANEIMENKSKILQQQGKQTMESVLTPFQKSIDHFKKEVSEIHYRDTIQQSELRKELESLKELNKQITTEAHELSNALKGQKKLQGNWGELVLENVLERSGLRADIDFKREVTLQGEEGKLRPDVVVYLPNDKHLIVDSKVSLNAYVRYVNAESEGERIVALNEHVNAVAQRVKELSSKQYHKLSSLNSPEIVFMFMPIESAFVEALKADESLFQMALNKQVLIATPTTLLTSLNIVRQLWRFEEQNKHTAQLADKAESIFKKLNVFLGSFESIKKSLDKASDAYQKAEGQLVMGRGNLVKQVNDFKRLAPTIRAELPESFVDKADLELTPCEEFETADVVEARADSPSAEEVS